MKPLIAILGAGLAAATLVTPATAAQQQEVGAPFVYRVSASSDTIKAGCVFRPDHFTLDYPPTAVDGYVVSTITPSAVSVRCSAYSNGYDIGSVWASGSNAAVISGESVGFFGVNSTIKICVEAYAASTVIDHGDQARSCKFI